MKNPLVALLALAALALAAALAAGTSRSSLDARAQGAPTNTAPSVGTFEIVDTEGWGCLLLDTRTGATWSFEGGPLARWIPVGRESTEEEMQEAAWRERASGLARLIATLEEESRRARYVAGLDRETAEVRAIESNLERARKELGDEFDLRERNARQQSKNDASDRADGE